MIVKTKISILAHRLQAVEGLRYVLELPSYLNRFEIKLEVSYTSPFQMYKGTSGPKDFWNVNPIAYRWVDVMNAACLSGDIDHAGFKVTTATPQCGGNPVTESITLSRHIWIVSYKLAAGIA